jgi:hypothetical protein
MCNVCCTGAWRANHSAPKKRPGAHTTWRLPLEGSRGEGPDWHLPRKSLVFVRFRPGSGGVMYLLFLFWPYPQLGLGPRCTCGLARGSSASLDLVRDFSLAAHGHCSGQDVAITSREESRPDLSRGFGIGFGEVWNRKSVQTLFKIYFEGTRDRS